MFFTYVIQSASTGRLYIGQTNDLKARLNKHNSDKNFSTKNRGPWKLVYFKEFSKRKDAMAFERKLKSFKNRTYLLDKIDSNEL
jgi:putative endonuclease